MQGIEKEMRMQLHFQRSEFGLGELGLERCLFQFARAEFPIVKQGMCSNNDERSDDQIDVIAEAEVGAITVKERGELSLHPRGSGPKSSEMRCLVEAGDQEQGRKMQKQVPSSQRPEFDGIT